MAADGSRGPRPFQQRDARTTFVRVPAADWPYVKRGLRTTFVGPVVSLTMLRVPMPGPCVAWSLTRTTDVSSYARAVDVTHDCRLMILEGVEQAVLGAVNHSELGFTTFAEFRRYWMARERRKFPPMRKCFVYRLSPWTPGRAREMADTVFNHLYGEFVDGRRDVVQAVA